MREEKVLTLIKKAELKTNKLANQILAPSGLTHTQLKVLLILYAQPNGSLRQIDLENELAMTNPTVTGILKNLEKKSLICKVRNPGDRRSKLIALTVLALRKKEEIYALADQIEKRLVEPLSNRERDGIVLLLEKLLSEAEKPESKKELKEEKS